jgi:hypothetical protein
MPKAKELPLGDGPGVGAVSIPEIDELAEDYFKEKEKRYKLTPKEVAAKGKLVDALHKHEAKLGKNDKGEIRYQFGDMVVVLKPGKEKLLVKEVDAFEEEDVT